MRIFLIDVILLVITIISFTYYILNVYYSTYYKKGAQNEGISTENATIIIPVYNEDKETFIKVIKSIKEQGAKFIVVGDSSLEPYKTITEESGGVFIYNAVRGGKKNALATGIRNVETKYVMFVDSDTIILPGTLKSMLTYFTGNVAGVGVNIHVKNDGRIVSYASEFVQRLTEMISKSMSRHGIIYVLDGICVVYDTGIIKPYILSDEFLNKKLLGKKVMLGDDMQLTSYLIKNKYSMIKDYDISVETEPEANFKKYLNQQIRWSRRGWYFFFKNFSNGTAKNGGKFYSFELLYIYLIPIIGFVLFMFRAAFFMRFLGHIDYLSAQRLSRFAMYAIFHFHSHRGFFYNALITTSSYIIGTLGDLIFIAAMVIKIPKNRIRTLAYGGIGLAMLFFVNLYGLATFWKQSKWLSR
ncbi:MAG: glycosyltransferase [Ferroplasma sp.]